MTVEQQRVHPIFMYELYFKGVSYFYLAQTKQSVIKEHIQLFNQKYERVIRYPENIYFYYRFGKSLHVGCRNVQGLFETYSYHDLPIYIGIAKDNDKVIERPKDFITDVKDDSDGFNHIRKRDSS